VFGPTSFLGRSVVLHPGGFFIMKTDPQKQLAKTVFFFLQFSRKPEVAMQSRADDVAEVLSTWAMQLPDIYKFLLMMHQACDRAMDKYPETPPSQLPVVFTLEELHKALVQAMPLDKVDNLLNLLNAANRNMNKADDT
jgi:hypothetical protein